MWVRNLLYKYLQIFLRNRYSFVYTAYPAPFFGNTPFSSPLNEFKRGLPFLNRFSPWIGKDLLQNLTLVASVGSSGHVRLNSINPLSPSSIIFKVWATKEEKLSRDVLWGTGVVDNHVPHYKEASLRWERMKLPQTEAQVREGEKKESDRIIISDSKCPWRPERPSPFSSQES